MRTSPFIVLLLAACPSTTPPATTDGPTTSTTSTSSTTGNPTTLDPTTTTTGAVLPDMGPPCLVGALGCPCTQGGSCDGELACEAGTCVEGCQVGSEGCSCTQGGGCDGGLVCEAGTCVVSPPCVQFPQSNCCGNGVLDPLEECDIGIGLNDDAGACTLSCKHATCGDGHVYVGTEPCDGGDSCTRECTFINCGDGVVQPPEWCEPRGGDDVECTPLCTDARKVIFITSTHYAGGEIGGLEGGNDKCQAHALAGGLQGTFKAWLGVSIETEPEKTWGWPPLPHVTTTGKLLFVTLADLCDMTELFDEFGQPHPGCTEKYEGTFQWAWLMHSWLEGQGYCGGWSDTQGTGSALSIVGCSMDQAGLPCNLKAPIICVEQ